jgi:alkanesulfonate monooxygenase SsuD/methylene tetrahydromethanopterin reductase-like flavin-dependent oxidoreductase (luciferase family)
VVLGALSQRTSKVRLGLGVALLPKAINHTIRVAERSAMLDIMSNGRLEMGTGRSSSPYQLESFGTEIATTREQWEESVKLIPRLWTEESISYHGRFYDWNDEITVVPRPLQRPHPPLWVAATQPDTCALAGDKGVGLLMPSVNAPETLRPKIESYRAAIANPSDPAGLFVNNQVGLFTLTFVHDDDEKARVMGGTAAMWYIDTIKEIHANDWRGTPLDKVPSSYRYHAEATARGLAAGGTLVAEVPTVTDRRSVIDQFVDSGAFCIGDPDRVVENVKKYIEVGGDRLVSVIQLADLHHDDVMRSIELFGTNVIPRVRAYEEETQADANPDASTN